MDSHLGFRRLLRRRYYVLVVGQDYGIVTTGRFHRLKNVPHAGVHGLAAADHHSTANLPEQAIQSIAAGDSYHR